MAGFVVLAKAMFLLALLFSFAFTGFVAPSSGGEPLRINGVTPSLAYWNDTVVVFGVGAVPGARVFALLAKSSNFTDIVGNGTGPWLDLGGDNLTVGSVVAGVLGDWRIGFVVPNVFPGAYVVCVSDGVAGDVVGFAVLLRVFSVFTGNVSYFPFNVTFSGSNLSVLPLLFFFSGSVVPSSAPAGFVVSMSGRFASGGEIVVYFDNVRVAAVVGQRSGDWAAFFVVPFVSVGVHTVRAIDVGGRWMSTASFSVTSAGAGFSAAFFVLLGFLALAAFSGLVGLVLLFGLRRRRRH